MTATPDVTVLMPARDAGRTVGTSLASVLSSEGVRLEVLIVDHGSVDDTAVIAASAARLGSVRILRVAREVPFAEALEEGRRACATPVVARMDADDLMHPRRLARDLELLRQKPHVDVVACRVRPFPLHNLGAGMRMYVAWQNSVLASEDHAREIWIELTVCHPSATFRNDVVTRVGGYRHGDFPEDYDLFLRLLASGAVVEKRPEVDVAWRQSLGSATRMDPRYTRDGLARAKVDAMVKRFSLRERPVFIAGAGKEGGRIARALSSWDVAPARFFDVSPKRIGRLRYGAPVVDSRLLEGERRAHPGAFCIGAVGTSGAREIVRGALVAAGFHEGEDAVVVA